MPRTISWWGVPRASNLACHGIAVYYHDPKLCKSKCDWFEQRPIFFVPFFSKEYKPDFIFPKLDLALEVKLSKTKAKSKEIVDEINADIKAYSKGYNQLLFLIYDMGTIRDEMEFKNDLDNKDNIQLLIIKN